MTVLRFIILSLFSFSYARNFRLFSLIASNLNKDIALKESSDGKSPPCSKYQDFVLRLRGGSTEQTETPVDTHNSNLSTSQSVSFSEGNCSIVIVTTSVGSVFLDKRKKLSVPRNFTISQLKTIVQQKFPGGPPASMQRLFQGSQCLRDDLVVGSLLPTASSSIPAALALDMFTGTSVYNKTMSISQVSNCGQVILVRSIWECEYLPSCTRVLFLWRNQRSTWFMIFPTLRIYLFVWLYSSTN